MAINLFDPETQEAHNKPRESYDVVGRFRSGHQINKRPISLQEWRVTSDDPSVTDALAELYGGKTQQWDNEKQPYEVFTNATTIPVIFEKVFSSMVLWGRNAVIRKCDGQYITFPDDQVGEPCPECSKHKTLQDRKDAEKRGTGCSPDIAIRFRLADDPSLGLFEFRSGAWGLATEINEIEADLEKFGGKAVGSLTLEPIEFTNKEGQLRKFTKMVATLDGPADVADAA